jgi:hypothetical protein
LKAKNTALKPVKLFDDAQEIAEKSDCSEKWIRASGVIGICSLPVVSANEFIEVYELRHIETKNARSQDNSRSI